MLKRIAIGALALLVAWSLIPASAALGASVTAPSTDTLGDTKASMLQGTGSLGVSAERTIDSAPGRAADPGHGASGSAAGAAGPPAISRAERDLRTEMRQRCLAMGETVDQCPIVPPEVEDGEETETAPAVPAARPLTIRDLASFTPAVGELKVQPDGWAAKGTPANFYATADSHVQNGTLFGAPVVVRWTPVSYTFDYGDGHATTTKSKGKKWRGTDEQWTETKTSHTYESKDDATASVTVWFAAEVNAGGGWFQVPGTLELQAPERFVKVFEVTTVLTNGDCIQNPTAPDCG